MEERTKVDLIQTFLWKGSLHCSWSAEHQKCLFHSLGCSLTYGYYYKGCGGRVLLSPQSERLFVYLLQVMRQQFCGLVVEKQVKERENKRDKWRLMIRTEEGGRETERER